VGAAIIARIRRALKPGAVGRDGGGLGRFASNVGAAFVRNQPIFRVSLHGTPPAQDSGEEGKVMLTEILSVAFLVGVPIWLVVEHVLHRSHIRAKAARLIEVRRPGRRTVAADRLTHAA